MELEIRQKHPLFGKIIVYLGLMVSIFAFFLYLQIYRPSFVKELILAIDVFGVTEVGTAEQQRLDAINKLSITYEEKQVLINKTVFLGASPQMVALALGQPSEQKQAPAENIYIYYLPDDPRPTILKFSRDKLVQAYKGSALDFAGGSPTQ